MDGKQYKKKLPLALLMVRATYVRTLRVLFPPMAMFIPYNMFFVSQKHAFYDCVYTYMYMYMHYYMLLPGYTKAYFNCYNTEIKIL